MESTWSSVNILAPTVSHKIQLQCFISNVCGNVNFSLQTYQSVRLSSTIPPTCPIHLTPLTQLYSLRYSLKLYAWAVWMEVTFTYAGGNTLRFSCLIVSLPLVSFLTDQWAEITESVLGLSRYQNLKLQYEYKKTILDTSFDTTTTCTQRWHRKVTEHILTLVIMLKSLQPWFEFFIQIEDLYFDTVKCGYCVVLNMWC